MAQEGQPGLPPRIVKLLLDKLITDNEFRKAFSSVPADALVNLGYTGSTDCMQLSPGTRLASPEEIQARRIKLEESLGSIHGMTCPLEAQGG